MDIGTRSTNSSLRSIIGTAFAAFLVGCGGGDSAGIATATPQLKSMLVACEYGSNQRYKVTLLDSLGGTASTPYAINNRGQVVGVSSVPGDAISHATIWNGQTVTNLGVIGEIFSAAYDINEAGQVAGMSWGTFGYSAISWFRAGATYLENLPGGASIAFGINNSGQIVGESEPTVNGLAHASVWNNGKLSTMGTLGGGGLGVAFSINDSGEIVGYSADSQGKERATLWKNGSPIDLGSLNGSKAHAINNQGQIVGESPVPYAHATLWYRGTITDLGTLGGMISRANAINNSGQIVGWSTSADERPHATIWYGTTATPVDLGTLLDETGAGLQIGDPADINDRGQIVAPALLQDGTTRAVVLTPTACQ